MPESTSDASILIAISHQAHERAKAGDKLTLLCDCTVMIVFAGFFIEANLNHIIAVMDKEQEILDFWGYRKGKKLGIQDKLAWFYNCFGDRPKINLSDVSGSDKEKLKKELYQRLREKFPSFHEIYAFRNDISHGRIDPSAANLSNAEALRRQAKSIVNELFKMAEQADYRIPRTRNYYDAIAIDKKD
jgi:hypothetical protein